MRVNAGFVIVAAHRIDYETEVVLGVNEELTQYVTWECKNGSNYYWGHYGTDFLKAAEDFKRRCKRNAG